MNAPDIPLSPTTMKSKNLSFDEVHLGIEMVLSNAEALIVDARVLFAAERYSRAYTLAHLAREELAKVPMMFRVGAEVLVDIPSDWPAFWKRFRDHKAKLAVDFLFQVPLLAKQLKLRPLELLATRSIIINTKNDLKNHSLYVSFTKNGFTAPTDCIKPRTAERTILLAEYSLGDARRYAETLKTLTTVDQVELRARFMMLESRHKEEDNAIWIEEVLERLGKMYNMEASSTEFCEDTKGESD